MSKLFKISSIFDLDAFPKGAVTNAEASLVQDSFGRPYAIPVIVVRGSKPGPVLGVTAAVHGNELNGIKVIHKLVQGIDPEQLSGAIVAVPVFNVPGFIRHQREFSDGNDLNRIMPGKETGTEAQQYAHAILNKIVAQFTYLIDLHTASFGRINSLYIRADLADPKTRKLAELQNAEILLHNCGTDGTLRSAAARFGIPALTVEVGNPQLFQESMIQRSVTGILNVMAHLEMIEREISVESEPNICSKSYWIYTNAGGILEMSVALRAIVEEGQEIARVTDCYGTLVKTYHAPEKGIVIGRSTNPVNASGARILHLGVLGENFSSCPI
ncbi:MAG: succinylglutamate desuccinylase/aspartoacylase family protein [Planctomycetota bacterium]|nr:succinylglutamate desuccinylase/aspartoacylase family protein [Planctomycetota bacterium]